MSLMPALISLVIVMLLSSASSGLVREAAWAAALRSEKQALKNRADSALSRAANALANGEEPGPDVVIDLIPSAPDAELDELPLMLHRVTATGEGRAGKIRLQADYALDGCESAFDDPCRSRVRRIAWRQLAD